MRHLLLLPLLFVLFTLSPACKAAPPASPQAETAKIEALLAHVAGLKDAKFVRNGTEYDAAKAARFLRGKWEHYASDIKTAEDFIEKAASMSTTTGKPYLIQFAGQPPQKCGDYLKAQLARQGSAPK